MLGRAGQLQRFVMRAIGVAGQQVLATDRDGCWMLARVGRRDLMARNPNDSIVISIHGRASPRRAALSKASSRAGG